MGFKLKTADIDKKLDNQIMSVMEGLMAQSKNKGGAGMGKYLTGGVLKDSVEAEDIARHLHPTVAGNPKAEFVEKINTRLQVLTAAGKIEKV